MDVLETWKRVSMRRMKRRRCGLFMVRVPLEQIYQFFNPRTSLIRGASVLPCMIGAGEIGWCDAHL